MKRLLVTLATAALFLTASAQAQYGGFGRLLPPRNANMGYKDGRDVLQLCTAQDETQLLECLGFLEGVSDLVVSERKAQGLPDCYPAKVDQIAIQETLIAFLIAHPERRTEQGASVVKAAIQARWCAH
jgi:hypothetical protein